MLCQHSHYRSDMLMNDSERIVPNVKTVKTLSNDQIAPKKPACYMSVRWNLTIHLLGSTYCAAVTSIAMRSTHDIALAVACGEVVAGLALQFLSHWSRCRRQRFGRMCVRLPRRRG